METLNMSREDVAGEIAEYCRKCIGRMEEIWSRLYGDRRSMYVSQYELVKDFMMQTLDEMVAEEQTTLEEHERRLIELIAYKETLQEELHQKIEVPFETDPNQPDVIKQVRDLTEYLKTYEIVKADRLRELISYKELEEELCDFLGEEPKYGSIARIPPPCVLVEIRQRVEWLMAEKDNRKITCFQLIHDVEELMWELGFSDVDAEQRDLLSREIQVPIPKTRITDLQEMKSRLVDIKNIQIERIALLKQKTIFLWDLLDVCAEERNRILNETDGKCNLEAINIWNTELSRCEALKLENISEIVKRTRKVIKRMWSDCHLSVEEQQRFVHFYDEKYDENLLKEHEKERERLSQYYEERKALFAVIEKWFTLWNRMILLEDHASGSANRFTNRGGQLLKEERERKAVQKELPKVEASMKKMVAEIEEKTQQQFTYDGRPLLEMIAEIREQRRKAKESEKERRRIQTRDVTPLKPHNGFCTPTVSVRKAGNVLAPIDNCSAKNPPPVRRELKMPVSANKQIRRRSKSHDPSIHCQDMKCRDENAVHLNIDDASVGSYAGFQDYLEDACKSGKPLRSSVSPSSMLPKSSDSDTENRPSPSFFKPPSTVPRFRKKCFGSSKILRPMIY